MADGLNRAMLIGNLGSDPELRYTTSNRAVLKFRMATTESYMDQNNTRQEVTHWHNIVLWGKRGEALSKILAKGSKIYVEGRIENRTYDDKDGVKRSISEIACTNLILLGSRGEGAVAGAGSASAGASAGAAHRSGGASPPGGGAGGASRGGSAGGGAPRGDHGAPGDDYPPDDFGGGGTGNDDDIPF